MTTSQSSARCQSPSETSLAVSRSARTLLRLASGAEWLDVRQLIIRFIVSTMARQCWLNAFNFMVIRLGGKNSPRKTVWLRECIYITSIRYRCQVPNKIGWIGKQRACARRKSADRFRSHRRRAHPLGTAVPHWPSFFASENPWGETARRARPVEKPPDRRAAYPADGRQTPAGMLFGIISQGDDRLVARKNHPQPAFLFFSGRNCDCCISGRDGRI